MLHRGLQRIHADLVHHLTNKRIFLGNNRKITMRDCHFRLFVEDSNHPIILKRLYIVIDNQYVIISKQHIFIVNSRNVVFLIFLAAINNVINIII